MQLLLIFVLKDFLDWFWFLEDSKANLTVFPNKPFLQSKELITFIFNHFQKFFFSFHRKNLYSVISTCSKWCKVEEYYIQCSHQWIHANAIFLLLVNSFQEEELSVLLQSVVTVWVWFQFVLMWIVSSIIAPFIWLCGGNCFLSNAAWYAMVILYRLSNRFKMGIYLNKKYIMIDHLYIKKIIIL